MGRSDVSADEVSGLLQASGAGDIAAFAAFYERTASVVFRILQHALGEPSAERATVRVYVRVWRTAPTFDPATMSGDTFLIQAVYREFGRARSRDPLTP